MQSTQQMLAKIEAELKADFERTNRILSFDQYLGLVASDPRTQLRGSAQYLLDMMDHFGRAKVENHEHYNLFDMQFDDPKFKVVGQNDVQDSIYSVLERFVKEGVNSKLILLHGPNGSAKSSLIQCMMRGMEKYSELQQGATYRFNWIFPVENVVKGNLGLGSYASAKSSLDSYAKLPDEDISAKIVCDMKDHPLLLLPAAARNNFMEEIFGQRPSEKLSRLPDYLTKGSLCQKCKQVFDALLTAYRGDLKKLLMHVQVERFFMSKRYRTGAVTIEPQMHVDAQSRQVTMDKSLAYLPASLHGLSLFEASGDLVDANRGMVEFADLLKRPVDTFKYLLTATETGSVGVGGSIALLDTVFIGSTNELQLDAFKEFPDFTSFKARIELVRVPYLMRYSNEKQIYDIQVSRMAGDKHVAPHTTFVAALWAVLSRLKKPNSIHYPPAITNIVAALTPLDKAKLYDHQAMPAPLSAEERKLLRSVLPRLRDEYNSVPYYEGRMGASAREIKSILFDAAQNPEFQCLSPHAVMRELDEFVKRVSEYEFLKQDVKEGYHDCSEFINVVRAEYLQILDQEVRESTGVFESHQYADFLKKYVQHLSHLLKKEKIKNPITGKMEPPDAALIEEFESIVGAPAQAAEREVFRNNVISSIGAYSLDNLGKPVDYGQVFPEFMRKLEDHYFEQHKSKMKVLSDAVSVFGSEKEDARSESHQLAKRTIGNMKARFGYCDHCAEQSITFLIKSKY